MFLEKRLTLTTEEHSRRNEQLLKHCQQFVNSRTSLKTAHIFVSMPEQNEPDTLKLIDWLIGEKQMSVLSSKTFYKERRLSHHKIINSTDFVLNPKGIPEPTNPALEDPKQIDIVFVPLISFDEQGNRIGYGAGLYDRFLKEVRSDCLKVGMAITPPLNTIDYTNEFDVSLDFCINHLGIYKF